MATSTYSVVGHVEDPAVSVDKACMCEFGKDVGRAEDGKDR